MEIIDASLVAPPAAPRSEFGIRTGAYLIDTVILFVLAFLLGPVIGGLLGASAAAALSQGVNSQDQQALAAIGGFREAIMGLAVSMPVICFIYFLIEGITGFTLGKLILGIRVGSKNGTKGDVSNLLVRFLLKSSGSFLSLLSMILSIPFLGTIGSLIGIAIFIGCFFVLGDKRQAFHDMLSKTAVYNKDELA